LEYKKIASQPIGVFDSGVDRLILIGLPEERDPFAERGGSGLAQQGYAI